MLSRLLILDLALQHPGPNAEFHADLPTGHGLLWSPISWVAQRLGGSVRRTKKWPNHFVSRLQQAFFYQDWKDPKRIKRAKRFFQNYCHFHGGCDNFHQVFTRFDLTKFPPSFQWQEGDWFRKRQRCWCSPENAKRFFGTKYWWIPGKSSLSNLTSPISHRPYIL